ncbi:Uncharacterized protein FWK35_00030696 [Aphis craccivora]|uniref:Dimer Tnp hAT domain-containing protein n=1 Tax=Aphis craccivora TaxID=307492 RepID=A0A6G0WMG4_APHCR|nr:Uncharacterized protein FWK35_00030696 [Aphis craccivora]
MCIRGSKILNTHPGSGSLQIPIIKLAISGVAFKNQIGKNLTSVTSVDVERSFSVYKHLLADNHRSFKFQNIKEALIVKCNANFLCDKCILFHLMGTNDNPIGTMNFPSSNYDFGGHRRQNEMKENGKGRLHHR